MLEHWFESVLLPRSQNAHSKTSRRATFDLLSPQARRSHLYWYVRWGNSFQFGGVAHTKQSHYFATIMMGRFTFQAQPLYHHSSQRHVVGEKIIYSEYAASYWDHKFLHAIHSHMYNCHLQIHMTLHSDTCIWITVLAVVTRRKWVVTLDISQPWLTITSNLCPGTKFEPSSHRRPEQPSSGSSMISPFLIKNPFTLTFPEMPRMRFFLRHVNGVKIKGKQTPCWRI